jgi:DNA-binding LytR/AlgR family response regulator
MLQGMTGMEAAARLRKHNADIIIIFVTNMTSFAIKSYEVDALDYIVKPVSYKRVVLKLQKALGIIKAKQEKSIVIKDATDAGGGLIHISSNDIYYIEVRAHKLTYHTKSGIFNEIGTLSQKEEVLSGSNFARCNACYLVNLRHVFSFGGYSVVMANGDELKISQAKKKTFTNILTDYLGQGKC